MFTKTQATDTKPSSSAAHAVSNEAKKKPQPLDPKALQQVAGGRLRGPATHW